MGEVRNDMCRFGEIAKFWKGRNYASEHIVQKVRDPEVTLCSSARARL